MWIGKVISQDCYIGKPRKRELIVKAFAKAKPILAFSLQYIQKCVGKIAINKAIMPQAA